MSTQKKSSMPSQEWISYQMNREIDFIIKIKSQVIELVGDKQNERGDGFHN